MGERQAGAGRGGKMERSKREAAGSCTQDQFYRVQTVDVLHLQLKYNAELNTC